MNIELKKKIIESGKSQVALAKELDVSPERLSQYVNQWREPSKELKKLIASKLNCKITDIF